MNDVAYWEEQAKERTKDGKASINQKKILQLIQRFAKIPLTGPITVSEIGCGNGYMGQILNFMFPEMKYVGVEIAPSYIEFAKKHNMLVYESRAEKLPFGDKSINCILMLDFLEHLNPKNRPQAYSEFKRVLIKPGLIILNNPLVGSSHDKDFEWILSQKDMNEFVEAVNGQIMWIDTYTVQKTYTYQFIVIQTA